jgi:hypothetical protein
VRSRLLRARAALAEQLEQFSEQGVAAVAIDADLEGWAGSVQKRANLPERED